MVADSDRPLVDHPICDLLRILASDKSKWLSAAGLADRQSSQRLGWGVDEVELLLSRAYDHDPPLVKRRQYGSLSRSS
jgi:hypothetical protein